MLYCNKEPTAKQMNSAAKISWAVGTRSRGRIVGFIVGIGYYAVMLLDRQLVRCQLGKKHTDSRRGIMRWRSPPIDPTLWIAIILAYPLLMRN